MTAHPHAELMMEYAKDAATNEEPWKLWECYVSDHGQWMQCYTSPRWDSSHQYLRKTKTHMVNGFEVEVPVQHADPTTAYYVARPDIANWVYRLTGASGLCQTLAGRGLVFATESAAIANAKAMVGINPHTSCPCKD